MRTVELQESRNGSKPRLWNAAAYFRREDYGIQHRSRSAGRDRAGSGLREAEGTYGYKITQDVRKAIDISESTLYPVLRRLQKENCLETYDMAFDGRNRRYYKLTETGRAQLKLYKSEWTVYSGHISRIFEEANV